MSKKSQKNPMTPEWPHAVEVEHLGPAPQKVALSSTAQQRRDLARRLKVDSVDNLSASVVVERRPNSHIIHVTGAVTADVVQSCVVTLEPVRTHLDEEIDSWFSDEKDIVSLNRVKREQQGLRADAELEILTEEEDPEPVHEGVIDVGELAAQYLSLAIDPYPRSITARNMPEGNETVITAGERPNPFAALKDWKAGKKPEK
jgi:uncharacterized metal-binding protein YceD (DUF177 family)